MAETASLAETKRAAPGGRPTVKSRAVAVLQTADPAAKAAGARALCQHYTDGTLSLADEDIPVPDRPARPARPELLPPAQMPARRRAGSARARFALLHALAHIEFNAIDLAVDIVARFGHIMPPDFTSDWLKVADEEAAHFTMVERLLAQSGGTYGDLPAHDGLWEAARETAHDLAARLAIVPLVLEARGLDVTPAMIARFHKSGDAGAAKVLQQIFDDEIGHVATGRRWFAQLSTESRQEPAEYFRQLVRQYFRGTLKPPFNDSARLKAGLTPDWYS